MGSQVAVVTRLKTGKGRPVIAGDRVAVHYVCAATVDDLLRGEHLDRSEWHGGGVDVVAGAGELLPCLDEAILQFCLGDTIRVEIPPEQGFGRRGVPGYVDPDSFLYFDIEISTPSVRKDAPAGASR